MSDKIYINDIKIFEFEKQGKSLELQSTKPIHFKNKIIMNPSASVVDADGEESRIASIKILHQELLEVRKEIANLYNIIEGMKK
jgi:hypothetical protein